MDHTNSTCVVFIMQRYKLTDKSIPDAPSKLRKLHFGTFKGLEPPPEVKEQVKRDGQT